jgi:hypothetical protein
VVSGVITGSGSINTSRLFCDAGCEIDVFTWTNASFETMEATGSLRVTGDVEFAIRTPVPNTPAYFARPILALGAFEDSVSGIKTFSQFNVTGKIRLEVVLVSCVCSMSALFCSTTLTPYFHFRILFIPNTTEFGTTFPASSIAASGGIFLTNRNQSAVYVLTINATEAHLVAPLVPFDIHMGRFLSGSLAPTGNSETNVDPGRPDRTLHEVVAHRTCSDSTAM